MKDKITKGKMILVGIGLAMLYWIFEAVAMVFIFHEGNFVGQILNPGMHEIWMRSWATGIIIAFGVYIQFAINKRKWTEKTLQFSDAAFKSIQESVVATDTEYTITHWNKVSERIYGIKASEAIGKKLFDVIEIVETSPGETAERVKKLEAQSHYQDEVLHKTKCAEVWVNVNVQAIEHNGKRHGWVALATDITKRKQSEEECKQSREYLRNLTKHLHLVREEERKSLARELHDDLGQLLTGLKMNLSWVHKRLPGEQETLPKKIKSMLEIIDLTIKTVKRISTELRPGILDDLGLIEAIEWQVQEYQEQTGIKCKLDIEAGDIGLDQERATTCFRIFQEVLTNALYHSNATEVNVSLKEKTGQLVLQVRDNGKGITEEQLLNSKSLGLIGMRERTYMCKGDIKISGIPNKGTTVVVSIPINPEVGTR